MKAVAAIAASLLALAVGCGANGDDDDRGDDDGVGGPGGNPTIGQCHEGCSRIEVICPSRWDAIEACVDTCLAEPYSLEGLRCVNRATSCPLLDACLR